MAQDVSQLIIRRHAPCSARASIVRALRCCDLVGCGRDGDQQPLGNRCVTAAVADLGRRLDGVDVVVDGRYVEVTAVPLSAGGGAVLHFEATAREATWHPYGRSLRITTLGPLRLEYGGVSLGGEWLDHRPGQLLKYLICARGKRVRIEELAETLWGNSGRAGLTSLRQAVHGLRDRLEPERPKHAPSRFVLARANAYELDTRNVVVDADEFEQEAVAVLRTLERSIDDKAEAQLARVAGMYRAEFLADEPYAEWALAERYRLRGLATRVLACARRNPSGPGTASRRVRRAAPHRGPGAARPRRPARPHLVVATAAAARRGRTAIRGRPVAVQACVRAGAGLHAGRSRRAARDRGVTRRHRSSVRAVSRAASSSAAQR